MVLSYVSSQATGTGIIAGDVASDDTQVARYQNAIRQG
jgi:hypothetical protein